MAGTTFRDMEACFCLRYYREYEAPEAPKIAKGSCFCLRYYSVMCSTDVPRAREAPSHGRYDVS